MILDQIFSTVSYKSVFMADHGNWLATYIKEPLSRVNDFYIVEVTDGNSCIRIFDNNEY